MNNKTFLPAIIVFLISSCGYEVEKKSSNKEMQQKRIEANHRAYEAEVESGYLREYLQNIEKTENYLWVDTNRRLENVEEAYDICESIGFKLPTKSQLSEFLEHANESDNNRQVKKIEADFIQDGDSNIEKTKILVCVK